MSGGRDSSSRTQARTGLRRTTYILGVMDLWSFGVWGCYVVDMSAVFCGRSQAFGECGRHQSALEVSSREIFRITYSTFTYMYTHAHSFLAHYRELHSLFLADCSHPASRATDSPELTRSWHPRNALKPGNVQKIPAICSQTKRPSQSAVHHKTPSLSLSIKPPLPPAINSKVRACSVALVLTFPLFRVPRSPSSFLGRAKPKPTSLEPTPARPAAVSQGLRHLYLPRARLLPT